MIKVLVIVSNDMASGGVEVYLNNVYSMIDLSEIRIDIFIPGVVKSNIYKDSLERLGCSFIEGRIESGGRKRYFDIYMAIKNLLIQTKYDVVHVNTGAITTEALSLWLANKHHVEIKIAHSHGTVIIGDKVQEKFRNIFRSIVCRYSDYKLGCSTTANISLFGEKEAKKAVVAKNGIDVQKYKFDQSIRDKIRSELNWEDKHVVGYVGRLSEEKNPIFLLKVFQILHKKDGKTLLAFFGEGDMHDDINRSINEAGLEKTVHLYGVKRNINEIMQGLDVLVVPSIREALGIVNIEAQVTGLPCVVSDVIPREVDVTGKVTFVSLEDSLENWSRIILQALTESKREDRSNDVINAGYDIRNTAKIIDEIYHKKKINYAQEG